MQIDPSIVNFVVKQEQTNPENRFAALVTKEGELERSNTASYPQILKDNPGLSELGQEDENGFTNFMLIKDID